MEQLKCSIVEYCKSRKGIDVTKSMANILLHLCAPNEYEPIASEVHKYAIRSSLKMFLSEGTSLSENEDDDILAIKKKCLHISKTNG